MTKHPSYPYARRRYLKIRETQDNPQSMDAWWQYCRDKDATGQQCVRFVDDLAERMQPMRW